MACRADLPERIAVDGLGTVDLLRQPLEATDVEVALVLGRHLEVEGVTTDEREAPRVASEYDT